MRKIISNVFKLNRKSFRANHLLNFFVWQRLNNDLCYLKDFTNSLEKKSFFYTQKILINIQSLQWMSFFWKKFFISRNLLIEKKNFCKLFRKLFKKIFNKIDFTDFKTLHVLNKSVFFLECPWRLHNLTLFRFYSRPKKIKSKNFLKNKHETILKNLINCSFCQKFYLQKELWNLSLTFKQKKISKFLKNFNLFKVVSWHFCLFCNFKIFSFHKNYWDSIPIQFRKMDNYIYLLVKAEFSSIFRRSKFLITPNSFDFLFFKYLNKEIFLFLEFLLFGSLKKKVMFGPKFIFFLNFFEFLKKKIINENVFLKKETIFGKCDKISSPVGGKNNFFKNQNLDPLNKKLTKFKKVLLFFLKIKNKKFDSFSLFF